MKNNICHLAYLEGQSATEFHNLLNNVLTSDNVTKGSRYSSRTADRLIREIAFHNVRSIYDLCHLMAAIRFASKQSIHPHDRNALPNPKKVYIFDKKDHGSAALFYSFDHFSPARFKTWFSHRFVVLNWCKGSYVIQRQDEPISGILIKYPDGSKYTVPYGRMPFLSALYDLLANIIGNKYLDLAEISILTAQDSESVVKDVAKSLQEYLREYLKPLLPSKQVQKKRRCLVEFMKNRHRTIDFQYVDNAEEDDNKFNGAENEGDSALDDTNTTDEVDFTLYDFGDEVVLSFWEWSIGQRDVEDFKLFKSAFEAFLDLRLAFERASSRLGAEDNSISLGSDRDAGEFDLDSLDPRHASSTDDIFDENTSPLDALFSPPCDQIKFLKKTTEKTMLEYPLKGGNAAHAFPLSAIRNDLFGRAQLKINSSNIEIDSYLEGNYTIRQQEYEKINSFIDRLLLASFHVLTHTHTSGKNGDALSLLLKLEIPKLDKEFLSLTVRFEEVAEVARKINSAAPLGEQFAVLASTFKEMCDDVLVCCSSPSVDEITRAALAEVARLEKSAEPPDKRVADLIKIFEKTGDDLFNCCNDPAIGGVSLAELYTEARLAFNGIGRNRKDFDEAMIKRPDSADIFTVASEHLLEIRRQLRTYLKALNAKYVQSELCAEETFQKDREIFRIQFARMYGGIK